ncbi:induced stolen tip protein TUB8-like [Miscanthus floridulus]|uniref:induced stolen tip protein TUB8-like n=1 Tax=Miscanthus floridulus TaxID=154761 RepID=UPI00345A4C88
MAEVEQVAARATRPPPQRVEGAPESSEGRPTPADMEAAPPPPPPPLRRTKDAVQKRLCAQGQWVVKAQAAIQRGAASARADPKEPVAQGEAAETATTQAGEEAPTPYEAEARESDGAEAPSVAEATEAEAEAPKTSEAEAMEAGASRTTEAEVAEAGAPGATEAEVAEAGVGTAERAA